MYSGNYSVESERNKRGLLLWHVQQDGAKVWPKAGTIVSSLDCKKHIQYMQKITEARKKVKQFKQHGVQAELAYRQGLITKQEYLVLKPNVENVLCKPRLNRAAILKKRK